MQEARARARACVSASENSQGGGAEAPFSPLCPSPSPFVLALVGQVLPSLHVIYVIFQRVT